MFRLVVCKFWVTGKWSDGKGTVVEFLEDGALVWSKNEISVSGKYFYFRDNRIEIRFACFWALAGPLVCRYDLSGDHLVLEMLGDSYALNRVR